VPASDTDRPAFDCALLIPCRNGASFLPRLFASVRAQDSRFAEVIVFDDGSSDNTAEVARAHGAKVLRSEASMGPSHARNRLVEATQCTWVHFHDADDVLNPRFLTQTAKAASAGNVDMIVCAMRWINEEDGSEHSVWHYDEAQLQSAPLSHLVRCTIGGINGTYRRSEFARHGGFEGRDFWEDLEFTARWLRQGARVRVIPEVLVTAYRRRGSYSNSHLVQVWRSKLALLERWLPDATNAEREVIATETGHIAAQSVAVGDRAGVKRALALNRRAGGNAPTTSHPLLRLLKPVLPGWYLLWLQEKWRGHRRRTAIA
jgi:glycosyltransferase involved in cell wall biosynthesis